MIATALVPTATRPTTSQNTAWVNRYPPGTKLLMAERRKRDKG
jgi:hypothetical protein